MKPRKIRKVLFYIVVLLLIACAGVWTVSHVLAPRLLVRVAVGGDQGESKSFMAALAPLVGSERWRLRFRQVNFDNPEKAAAALENGQIDLLIARSDLAPLSKGQTISIIRRDVIALVVPPDTQIEKFADIAKRAIAIPEGPLQKQNEILLDQLLDYYAIARTSVTRVVLPAADIGQAIRQKRVTAAFVVGPAGYGHMTETVASIRKIMRKPPTLLELGEASAIVKKLPRLETMEVSRGAVNGNPAIPDDVVNTLGVSVRLLAPSGMSNSLAGDLARITSTRKALLADAAPGAIQIEAPDTEDTNALLPVHPGAVTYFSGETPTLFDRFENFIYYGGLFASLVGSLLAWLIGRRRSARVERDEVAAHISSMLASVREISRADLTKRKLLAQDIDMHADWALGELAAGRIDHDSYRVFDAILTRGREQLNRSAAF